VLILIFLWNWFFVFILVGQFVKNGAASAMLSLLIMLGLVGATLTPVGETLLRLSTGMRKAIQRENQRILPILEDLYHEAEIAGRELKQKPELYIADQPFPSAFALGRRTVAVTTGLIKSATDEELKGVLAHELGHLYYGDSARSATAMVLNFAGNVATWMILAVTVVIGFFGKAGDRSGVFSLAVSAFVVCLRLFVWICGKLLDIGFRAVGRKEEFRADEFAFMIGAGAGLLSFLEKMADFNFSPNGFWECIAATHPPVMLRLDRLDTLSNGVIFTLGEEIAATMEYGEER
jgi:Zn-dependent protease with chaperone function